MSSCEVNLGKPTEIAERLRLEIGNATKMFAIYLVIGFILFVVFIICVTNIVKIVQFYYSQRKSLRETSIKRSTNNLHDPKDDEEVYLSSAQDKIAENNDEYQRYTEQINKSVAEFKNYNEKLKQYYKENKPGDIPKDIIDKSIINNSSDNY